MTPEVASNQSKSRAKARNIRTEFDKAWSTGFRPAISEYLHRLPQGDPWHQWLINELAHIDLENRIKAGDQAPIVGEYLQRFPCELSDASMIVELIQSEYQRRWLRESGVTRDDYINLFPAHVQSLREQLKPIWACPKCRARTPRTIDDETAEVVSCPHHGDFTVNELREHKKNSNQLPRIPNYEIVGEPKHGSMGIVYKARMTGSVKWVAIKMILAGRHADDESLARFKTEAAAIAKLRHANIIDLDRIGEIEGQPFLVLEYAPGGNLGEVINRTPQDPKKSSEWVKALAEAIHCAHSNTNEQGKPDPILHRDLKPENILFDADGVPKIADFGLSRFLAQKSLATKSGEMIGTPSYMAPEQATGNTEQITPKTDVYGLGTILYELLTGRPPFIGTDPAKTRAMVIEDDPIAPQTLAPETPRDLETICLKCLAKNPHERYASADELAMDLQRHLNGERIHAKPDGIFKKGRKWVRRHPRITAWALAGFVGVALAVISYGWWASAQNAEQLRQEKDKTEEQKERADNNAAELIFLKGKTLSAEGDGASGILWMAHSLKKYPNADWKLQRAIRTAMASTAPTLHTLEKVYFSPRKSQVNCAAFSPDGKLLLMGGGSGAWLMNSANGENLFEIPHDPGVFHVNFSPDGRYVATGTGEGKVRVVAVATGKPIGPDPNEDINHGGRIMTVAFHPRDRKTILAGARQGLPLQMYDFATQKKVGPTFQCKDNLYSAAFSPDGSVIATGAQENNASLWDSQTGMRIGDPLRHDGVVYSVSFSPDGKTLVTGCHDGSVRFWRVPTLEPVGPVLHHKGGRVRSAVFTPDGQQMLSSSEDGMVRLWDVTSGRAVGQELANLAQTRLAILQPEPGRQPSRILTFGYQDNAQLWRLGEEPAVVLPNSGPVVVVAFGAQSQVLTGTEGRFGESRLWDIRGKMIGKPMPQHGQILPSAAAFSGDGKWIVTGGNDGNARLWSAADGTSVGAPWPYGYVDMSGKFKHGIVASVAFSPDNSLVAIGGQQGKVQLRRLADGEQIAEWQAYEEGWVWSLAFTSDGMNLVTGGGYSTQLRSAKDGRLIEKLATHPKEARIIVISPSKRPDGQVVNPEDQVVLTCGKDGVAQLISIWDRKPLGRPMNHQGEVLAGAFRPDGAVVATASADGTVRLWDARNGLPYRQESKPILHNGWVRSVAFSPDGKRLVTGCEDGTAQIWDAENGISLGVLHHGGSVNQVTFSPDGKKVLAGSRDKTARIWSPRAPVDGNPELLALWSEVLTRMELDSEIGIVRKLTAEEWQGRQMQLKKLGGSPKLKRLE